MVGRGLKLHPVSMELTTVHYHVLRAAYEIPLCVSYLFLVVQSLRAQLNDMREHYAQTSPEA